MVEAGREPGHTERRATMRDVARRAGVSVMTVSRVVNGGRNVQPTTQDRVQAAIRALGYRQNAAASALRRSGSASVSVGLVVDDVANPFCSELTSGVERVCRARGHLLLSGSSGSDAAQERTLISAFLARRVDGLIVMGSDEDHGYLAGEARRGVHLVFVDRSPSGLAADTVTSDNAVAARIATAHLLHAGHHRVALLGARASSETARLRQEGYRAALHEAGVAQELALERMDLVDVESARRALGALLDGPRPPTAVFAAQNLVTIGALQALHQRGLQHTVALVGLDDIELAALLDPPVTVLAQAPEQIGARAATLLFDRLAGLTGPPRRVGVPVRLICRGSGEIPPPGHTLGTPSPATTDSASATPVRSPRSP